MCIRDSNELWQVGPWDSQPQPTDSIKPMTMMIRLQAAESMLRLKNKKLKREIELLKKEVRERNIIILLGEVLTRMVSHLNEAGIL